MNTYTPARYDERVLHLALGVEPRAAVEGQRLDAGVDVRWECFPHPLDRWRTWRPGETLTDALPALARHRSGRFARRYDEGVRPVMDVRVVDDERAGGRRLAGRGRRIVPRRLRLAIADEQDVLAAEGDPGSPPHPLWRRVLPVACFPGASAELPSGATVLRGRVVRDPGDGVLRAVRWARVRATAPGGAEIGWAHGDDRGEFVLLARATPEGVGLPVDPLRVELQIGARVPPPEPDPADPLRSRVDPLWDLPLEHVAPAEDPTAEPTLSGRGFLAEHTVGPPESTDPPLLLPHGRQTSVVVRIP